MERQNLRGRVVASLKSRRAARWDGTGHVAGDRRPMRAPPSSDVLIGSPRGDLILGIRGNDRISSGGGNDLVLGMGGRDRLAAGPGRKDVASYYLDPAGVSQALLRDGQGLGELQTGCLESKLWREATRRRHPRQDVLKGDCRKERFIRSGRYGLGLRRRRG